MAYPDGVTTRPISFGPAFTLGAAAGLSMEVQVKPSRSMVWNGTPMIADVETYTSDDGMEQTAVLPVCDLDGWHDGAGNAIVRDSDGYTHSYRLTVIYKRGARPIQQVEKTVVIPTGDGSVIDLDDLVPVTSSGGVVVSVPDTWDAKITAAQTAATDAAASAAGAVTPDQVGAPGGVATTQQGLAPRVPHPRFPKFAGIVTQFQTGHGWQVGAGTWNLNDTTDYVVGSQSISAAASSRATPSYIDKWSGPTYDFTGKHLAFLVKVDNLANLENIVVSAGDSTFANYTVFAPIKGSASDPSSTIRSNEWFWVFTTLASKAGAGGGNGAWNAVTRWRIKVMPQTEGVPVTVHINQIAYFTPPPAFPNGAVVFTFDDCFGSQTWAEGVLAANGIPANLYVIADRIDAAPTDGVPWLTSAQVAHMHDVSGWEISGHAYTRAAHNAGYDSLSPDELDYEFAGLKAWLVNSGYRGSDHFAWPQGKDNPACMKAARRYFATGRGISQSGGVKNQLPSIEVGDMPMRIRAHVPASTDLESDAETLVNLAYDSASLLVFGFHQLVDTVPSPSSVQYLKSDFTAIVNKVVAKGIPVATMGGVLRAAGVI